MDLVIHINDFDPSAFGSSVSYDYRSPNDFKYLDYGVEHPKIGGVILPLGIEYIDVSSSFLDGFINYYLPLRAYLLNCSIDWDTTFEKDDIPEILMSSKAPLLHDAKYTVIKSEYEGYNRLRFPTKRDIYTATLKNAKYMETNTSISMFRDDVVILGKSRLLSNEYMVFYYDTDVSNCCIGRFQTEDTQQEVIKEFDRYELYERPENRGYYNGQPKPLTMDVFRGWLKW